jgi:hypothetical protein
MELISFKTNISSSSALLRVAPLLNAALGSANWELDITSTDKTLRVFSPGKVNEKQVVDSVHQAGYYAVNTDDYYAIY